MTRDYEQRIEDFAKLLMTLVRDEAIDACERLADGRSKGPSADHWREVIARSNPGDAVSTLTPDVVDQVLFRLLDAIDNDQLELGWRRSDGSWSLLSELGHREMAGWLVGGKEGWIERYSAKPYFDPLTDLAL